MAISVPIGLPHRNVFLSYNYEFNYYQPEHVYKYPPILMGQDFEDSYLTYPTTGRESKGRYCQNCTDWKIEENKNSTSSTKNSTKAASREKRGLTLMSRSVFYAMLRDKLRSPSSSKDEHLPNEYYQAEWDGRGHQECSAYTKRCDHNILDLVSVSLEQALSDIIFAAIAVPLELPHRNVFVSYNFEANYNLPTNWEKWTIFQNGPIESEEVVEETDTETDAESSRKLATGCQNCTVEEENEAGGEEVEETTEVLPKERKVRSLLTRSNIYRIFIDKLKSPSSSESEDLPLRYYQAEHDGWNGHCHVYEPVSYDLPRTWKKKPPFLRHGNGTNDESLLSDHHGHHQNDDFVYDDYYDDDQHSGNKHKHKHHQHHHDKKKKKTEPKPGSDTKPQKNKPKHKHKKKHKSKPKPPPEVDEDDYKDFFQGFPLDGMGESVARDRQIPAALGMRSYLSVTTSQNCMVGMATAGAIDCDVSIVCST
ncbi:GM21535 [Drosophila sechellia]|uniref:GM21535 n=1 Tax=Drosophila sechellia TaxID=7238 RepID=B4HRB7_DROSE|nr:GM21535 [Drosophila sechellia]